MLTLPRDRLDCTRNRRTPPVSASSRQKNEQNFCKVHFFNMSRQPGRVESGRWQPEVTLDEVSILSRDIMSLQTYGTVSKREPDHDLHLTDIQLRLGDSARQGRSNTRARPPGPK